MGGYGEFTMYHTYQPFNQVCYKGNIAQIHSTSGDINISYMENGYVNNIFVKGDEITPIPLTIELLDKLIGNRKTNIDDFIVRFEKGTYIVRVKLEADDSWTVSVNDKNDKKVKYLHELQNYIRCNANKHILFLVNDSNALTI